MTENNTGPERELRAGSISTSGCGAKPATPLGREIMQVQERSSATGASKMQPAGPSAKSASQSCHPDQIFRCGVTAAQRPLKPSGVGAEPAAEANILSGIKPQ